jgi:hypothetical protein
MLVLALACSAGSTPASTPSDSGSSTTDTVSIPTTTTSSTTIPLTCEAPPGFPTAGCCGDGLACACDLDVLCDLGACDPVTVFLQDHPVDPQQCLLTGLDPSYVAQPDGSPSYHLRCETGMGEARDEVVRWWPSMEQEVWVFDGMGLAAVSFGGESGQYCDGTSPELDFGPYEPLVGCCEVRDPALTDGCRFPACE